ncbi:MAG: ESPR domain-containing protein, partial [Xanthomonadaceae bacterium]|nr:ESPR domain-containing protein [Xanthomonadaceae bacterium]
MNHVYRIVWRAAQQTWVVVSELARGKVKSSVNESSGIAAEGCLVDVTAWRRSVLGLAVLAAMPLSAAAQTNFYWNGSADSNIDNAANWTSMSGGTPGYSDDAYINVSGPNPAMLLFGYEYLHANKLYIGDGAGSNGVLKVDFSDPDLFDPGVQVGDGSGGSALTIGGNGGNGLLDVDLDVVEQYRGMYMWGDGVSTLDIGAGTNSTGTVNILGNGKTPALQSMQGGLMTQYFGAVRVGVDQGTGEINIIGGSFDSSDTTQGQLL